MERIDYDPEGGNYLPVTRRETGNTLVVAGLIMLIAALGWLLYARWDIRAGGELMLSSFIADVATALGLMVWGFRKRIRQKT
jgi:hypothetical protein